MKKYILFPIEHNHLEKFLTRFIENKDDIFELEYEIQYIKEAPNIDGDTIKKSGYLIVFELYLKDKKKVLLPYVCTFFLEGKE